jgi:hypothetical protein
MRRAHASPTILAFLAASLASSPGTPQGRGPAAPIPVPRAALDGVLGDIRRSEYAFSSAGEAAWSAPNRAQDLRVRLDASGLRVAPRRREGDWEVALTLTRFGRDGSLVEVPSARPSVTVGRAELRRDSLGLTEWYVNDERGVEQGFTLARAPSENGSGSPVVLEMRLPEGWAALATAPGGVVFASPSGTWAVQYGGLRSWDASGRELPSSLRVLDGGIAIHVEDQEAPYPITVDPLMASPVWTAEADLDDSFFGQAVAFGNVDGDAYDDVIVGAPQFDNGHVDEGKVFVYRGTAAGLVLHWSAEGNATSVQFGYSVAAADVDGDGDDDVVVGMPFYESAAIEADEGRALLYLGSPAGLPVPPAPAWTAESNDAGARFGFSVANAGNLDADAGGREEVLVGAPFYDSAAAEADEGKVYAYGWTGATLALGWTAESNQVTVAGQTGARLGYSVASAGSVNGDAPADIIAGAPGYDFVAGAGDDRGAVFIWHGVPGGPPPSGIGAAAWSAAGAASDISFGAAVAGAGDVNNDGFDEVLVGAPFDDAGELDEGRVFLFSPAFGAAPVWTAESDEGGAQLGFSVAGAGDVDADGFGDLLAGSPLCDLGPSADRGCAFVWRGSAGGPPGPVGRPGNAYWAARSEVPGARFGIAVAGGGDVDADGRADVLVGAYRYAGPEADEGRALVYVSFDAPAFLEFGPRGDPRRVEASSAMYASVRTLVTGDYDLAGSASVEMGVCGPACTRPFTFAGLRAVLDPNDAASGGEPAFRITAGSATVDASADPIEFPQPDDLLLSLYSFALDPSGAATEPAARIGGVPSAGLFVTLPATLTTAFGSVLDFPSPIPIEQDLDFTTAITPDPGGIVLKDYPISVVPRAGTTYTVGRTTATLGLSDLAPRGREQGQDTVPGSGQTRCALTGACLEEANDDIFGLKAAGGASLWDLNAYEGDPNVPAGSVGSPFVTRGGLRATLLLRDVPGGDYQYRPLFPAGFAITLAPNSRIEISDSEPAGGSLDGSMMVTLDTGTVYAEDLEGDACADVVTDCSGLQSHQASFSGARLTAGGRLHAPSLSPLLGWDTLHWGGPGPLPGDPVRGFYAGGLVPDVLSFFAPGSLVPQTAVPDHFLSKLEGGTTGRGTYAGLNVRKDPNQAFAVTAGLDTLCPAPAGPSGHSLSVAAADVRLYARLAGVTGVTDAGGIASTPFAYMGYDLTLQRYGATFLDNVVRRSGVAADHLQIPYPSDVGFDFDFTSEVELLSCGDFGGMGDLSDLAERRLAYWAADFRPETLAFEPAVVAGGGCAPEGEACTAEIPVSCVGPGMDPEDVRYVHVTSNVPLDLEVQDPNRYRFRDRVDFEFTPASGGNLVCSDLIPAGPAGSVRNEFEPDLGFDVDLADVHLRPRDPLDAADPETIADPNARYEVGGEVHVPFFGATRAAAAVYRRAADVRDAFGDAESKIRSIRREVMGGLFDMDLKLEYLPPDLASGLPARFATLKSAFDLRFVKVPVSLKAFGRGHPLGGDAGLPEMFDGYLADLAAYGEARIAGQACGGPCEAILRGIADDVLGDPEDLVPPEMYAALDAGYARLASRYGAGALRTLVASQFEDAVGSLLPADVARAAGRVGALVEGVRDGFRAFDLSNLTGPAAFEEVADEPDVIDFVLDRIDVNADVEIAGFLSFPGRLTFQRHTVTDPNCGAQDTADVTVEARDVGLDWIADGVRAKEIGATFRFDPPPTFEVWGFDGWLDVQGISFGDVHIDELGFMLGMGKDTPCKSGAYYYVAGKGRGRMKTVTAEAGFFLGKSVDIEPLEFVDEDVSEILEGIGSLSGVYARAGGSVPVLSGPDCIPFNLTAGGTTGFWLFSEGPSFGAKMRSYAHGNILCAVSARADLTLLGGLTGDVWHLAGEGFAAGGVGWCEPESWDSPREALRDDWCFACVLSGEFRTDSRLSGIDGSFSRPDCN